MPEIIFPIQFDDSKLVKALELLDEFIEEHATDDDQNGADDTE